MIIIHGPDSIHCYNLCVKTHFWITVLLLGLRYLFLTIIKITFTEDQTVLNCNLQHRDCRQRYPSKHFCLILTMHFLTKQIRTDRTSHPRRLFFFRFKVICEFYCCQRLVGKQQNSFLTIMGSHLKVGNNFGFLPMRHNGKFITSLSDIEGSIPPSQVTAMILILQFNFLILRKN